jgi:hypothetical protein
MAQVRGLDRSHGVRALVEGGLLRREPLVRWAMGAASGAGRRGQESVHDRHRSQGWESGGDVCASQTAKGVLDGLSPLETVAMRTPKSIPWHLLRRRLAARPRRPDASRRVEGRVGGAARWRGGGAHRWRRG